MRCVSTNWLWWCSITHLKKENHFLFWVIFSVHSSIPIFRWYLIDTHEHKCMWHVYAYIYIYVCEVYGTCILFIYSSAMYDMIHQFSGISATCHTSLDPSLGVSKRHWSSGKSFENCQRPLSNCIPSGWIHPGRLTAGTWEYFFFSAPWTGKIIFQSIMFRFYVNLPAVYHILLHGLVGIFFCWRRYFPVNVSDQYIETWSFGLMQPMEVPQKAQEAAGQ